MTAENPSVLLLRGNDPTRFTEEIARVRTSMGDESLAEMNTTLFDGDSLKLEELRSACLTIPFLTELRLVIVEKGRQFLAKVGKSSLEKALAVIAEVPESTRLLFLIGDELVIRRRERNWENARQYAWLVDWIHQDANRGKVVNCELPRDEEMPKWVLETAKAFGGSFEPGAAHLLASYIGNDTLRARQEIEKLLIYAGSARPVSAQDVILLTAQEQEGDIFELTDALGDRDGKKAMRQFRILAEQKDMVELAPMIQRHFRQLIQVREILDEGGQAEDVAKELNLPPFVAQKLANQAKRFNLPQLIAIFGKLLEIDESMKTGGLPGDIAFEVLIARLTL
ncbi:MAG TPA: DNA polymerase III subunit delta [Anaerolineaceae bacterium]|nr:DNA polymerase III subunit delta [Anaerolineaceae bacterium]